ncbi:MAG: DNA repair protein RecN [Alphaproteobacteria bacterium]|nr:DNA repair protein RecN [Alphaproteobacteria bacterium]
MLASLSIRDVVLIDRLGLDLAGGLVALTGETGAGKSILLDALGLALGARGDSGLVAKGAEQALVTASFDLARDHPAFALLDAQGLAADGGMVLRRVVGADGRSRGFVNDQPVSIGLLRQLGETLIEVHGQHESLGLLDPARHRDELDAFAGIEDRVAGLSDLWNAWRAAEDQLAQAKAIAARARAEEEYLRHVEKELADLDPKPGEADALAAERTLLQQGEKLRGALAEVDGLIGDDGDGVLRRLAAATRLLGRIADRAPERIEPVLSRLDRAANEAGEAAASIERLRADIDGDPGRLERLEDRLFALRAAARKHQVEPDRLGEVLEDARRKLKAIDGEQGAIDRLSDDVGAARATYATAAEALSSARKRAASRLDKAVTTELPPLKLEAARFRTVVEVLGEGGWGPTGMDRVAFEVSTNPGLPFGPLARIASGGEVARFTLALKVVLAAKRGPTTLIFDEVDTGIGGATANAVGERLARLAAGRQVLVVTHSPQVAARATHHYRVLKEAKGQRNSTRIEALGEAERREEVARMLAGATVTREAREAAASLIAGKAR